MSKDSSGSGKPRRLGRGLSALVQTSVPIDPMPESPGGRTSKPYPATGATGPSGGGAASASETEVKPLPSARGPGEAPESEFQWLPIDSITPSPFQPRTAFDDEAIRSLAESIKRSGMMQPLVVRPIANGAGPVRYELVAGERRLRAAQQILLERAPAIVRMIGDQQAAELALVENLQRRDLNPIERSFAFRRLRDQFGLSQEQIGERVGLDRSSVSNIMRLADLEDEIRELIASDQLGSGHGKALLGVEPGPERVGLAKRASAEHWSVRRLEQETGNTLAKPPVKPASSGGSQSKLSPVLHDLERRLGEHLGTKVQLKTDRSGVRGSMKIEFYSLDQFDGLLSQFGYTPDSV